MESEAPPSAGWYNFLGWLDANKKRVAMIVAVVAVVALIAGLVIWRNSEREGEASQALSAVRVPFNPTEPLSPTTPEEYLKVAEKYGKTAASAQATIRAGTAYFDLGEFTKAQDTFTKFISKYGDTPWVPQAQYGIAASLDAQGRTQDAITKYNDFLKSYGNDPAADEARFSLARLYEKANQPAQAVDVLTKMTNGAAPFSPVLGQVQEHLKAIYAKNPALAPAPVVRAPTATPTMLMTNFQRAVQSNITVTPKAPTVSTSAPQIKLSTPTPATPAK